MLTKIRSVFSLCLEINFFKLCFKFFNHCGFNFVNTIESPITIIEIIASTVILNVFASLNKSASPNIQTPIRIIGIKYFIVKTQVFPTLKVENSFSTGMTFSTP